MLEQALGFARCGFAYSSRLSWLASLGCAWMTDLLLVSVCTLPLLQVTVCWVEEVPGGNQQCLSSQAEHAGIRTYFFSAENNEEQEAWIQAMGEAARVQIPPAQRSALRAPLTGGWRASMENWGERGDQGQTWWCVRSTGSISPGGSDPRSLGAWWGQQPETWGVFG